MNMNLYDLIGVIITMIFGAFTLWIYINTFKKIPNDGTNVIRMPRLSMWLGILVIVFYFAGMAGILLVHFELWPLLTVSWVLVILGIYLIMLHVNWRMEFTENGFYVQNFLKIRKFILYSDAEYVAKDPEIFIYKKNTNKVICGVAYYQPNIHLIYEKIPTRPETPKKGWRK
jgi:hypothetical protein